MNPKEVDVAHQYETLAILVSAIPLTSRGPAKIIIYDIHALQERFYFSDKVIPRLETAIPLLLRAIKGIDNLCIVFPDEGAYKRFHLCFPSSQFADDMFVTCIKVRFGDSVRRVTIKEGDPVGKHCVIIDDLVMTGGTLLECAKLLISNGAKDVSAYVTHAVFPNESWKLFTPAYTNSEQDSSENASSSANSRQGIIENHTSPDKMGGDEDFDSRNGPVLRFSRFWITDSLPNSLTIAKNKPFVLLSLANVIADTLLGYDLCVS
ncbi:uncharacterized protein LOC135929673 isoform X2 [Gordionus sp. m RMFG-2023]|uniref:uncharacterized protein LOC135929673 isoform X2 n=1 Tax=Gordionus sp. m RMFG-2023 TaxID=3053472 RepID=UPI0031FBE1FD